MKKSSLLLILLLFSTAIFSQDNTYIRSSQYFHYTGTVSKNLSITADLTIINDTSISGYYSYNNYGVPILLRGKIFTDKKILLYEYDHDWQKTAELKGIFDQSKITGTFLNLKTNKKSPFLFHISDNANSIIFKGFSYYNKKYIKPINDGPSCTINYNVLYPEKISNNAVYDSITSCIKNTFFSGSLVNDPVKLLYNCADSAFATFFESNPDTTNLDNMLYMQSWDYDEDVRIIYNTNDILSIEFFAYYYTGGAHGGYGSIYRNIDLKTGKTISLDDILKTGYKDELSEILTKSLRKQYGMNEKDILADNGFFVEKIDPSSNYYLTNKGIGFVYNPYEIASFANGTIDIFVPFSEIANIVK